MATLDELLKIDGVVAAGEFSVDGKLVDYPMLDCVHC
jgi:roadblock/LC7 domain-containing protein